MYQIIGGRVSYSRTIQPAPYESKKGEAELSFVLEDGEAVDNALDEIGDMVMAKAIQLAKARDPR
jgi:hypothetical protein